MVISTVHRKIWNQQQKQLRSALLRPDDHPLGIELFLSQHAMVHSAQMSRSGLWSGEDEVCQDLSEDAFRRIPRNGEHSIAWCLWHIARIEDVTMNLLLAGVPQILSQEHWFECMKITASDTGNAMNESEVADLSAEIDIESLKAYRQAVGRRTREVVKQLQSQQLTQKVDPSRLQQVIAEGAVVEAARGLIDYWGGLTIAGLLLMPPTRHNFIHLNEALRIRQKRG